MGRLALALLIASVAMSLAALPLCSPSEPTHTARRAAAKPVDAPEPAPPFAWLHAMLASDGPTVDDAHVGGPLVSLDRALGHGVEVRAPEIFGYDRAFLVKLQPDWKTLKPDLQPSWDAWMAKPGVVVDEVRLRACEDAFAGSNCARMQEEWSDCTAPFKGALGEGDACDGDEQCTSGVCDGRLCTRPDDCARIADCPAGLLCADDGSGDDVRTCLEPPADGDPCLENAVNDGDTVDPACGPGRACDEDSRCFPARAERDSCGPGEPCGAGLFCDDDARCAVDSEADDEGDPSRSDQSDDDSCACDPYTDGKACLNDRDGNVRCVPAQIVELGDACDDVRVCRGSLGVTACIDGTCAAALSLGDTCGQHEECKDDLVCIDGACTPPRHAGEPCSSADDCIFGLECFEEDGACGVLDEGHEDVGAAPELDGIELSAEDAAALGIGVRAVLDEPDSNDAVPDDAVPDDAVPDDAVPDDAVPDPALDGPASIIID